MTVLIERARQDDLHAVWLAMPAVWRDDVQSVVHQFAANVDPELLAMFFAGMEAVHAITVERPEEVRAAMNVVQRGRMQYSASQFAQMEVVQRVLLRLPRSKEGLGRLDVGEWLRGDGKEVLVALRRCFAEVPGNSLAQLDGMACELRNGDANRAEVQFLDRGKAIGPAVPFVRIEGRWVPEALANEWASTMASVRSGLDRMAEPATVAAAKQGLSAWTQIVQSLRSLAADGLVANLRQLLRPGDDAPSLEVQRRTARINMKMVDDCVRLFQKMHGRWPTVADLVAKDARGNSFLHELPIDPWDSPYEIEVIDDGRRCRIRSRGPDRKSGTADDILRQQ